MKWSVFGLIGVGVLAAMCAAALVVTLRAWGPGGGSSGDDKVSIVIATANLQRLTMVLAQHVTTRAVPRDQAEKGDPSNPSQVIGRVLGVDVVEGQHFRKNHFVDERTVLGIVSSLDPGMRAVCLPLSKAEALTGALYPGAMVDVMAAFKTRSGTLLRGVYVLAIGGRTNMSETSVKYREDEGGKSTKKGQTIITLRLTPQQATTLQMARRIATISLSLRNPTDSTPVGNTTVAAEELLAGADDDMGAPTAVVQTANGQGDGQGTKVTRKASPRRARYRTVLIIRGSKHEEAKLRVDTGKEAAPKS